MFFSVCWLPNFHKFKLASLWMRGAQERALLVPDDNIVIYRSCTIIKITVLNKYRLLYTQIESNSVLVADGNTTSAVSSTRREELDQNTYGLRNR